MGEPVPPRPPPKAIDPRLRRWAQSLFLFFLWGNQSPHAPRQRRLTHGYAVGHNRLWPCWVGNWVKGALPGFLVSYRRGLEFAKFLTAHGRLFPSPIYHICRRQMSIPPRQFITSAAGRCLFPLAIYGEGVADRPGVRSRATPKSYFHHSRKQTKWAKKILTNRKSSHI